MRSIWVLCLCLITLIGFDLSAEGTNQVKPFTGRVTRDKVRMRLNPSLDSPVIRELDRDDLVIVTGTSDDFFQVRPPAEQKVYVYRTFVLDNVIEGNKVNVRLDPNLDSPVIAQLNSGDVIEGQISPLNSKWYEITPPSNTNFYIASEYVEKVGDANYLVQIQDRKDEVKKLLTDAQSNAQMELQKPYPEVNLDDEIADLNKIINSYTDFPNEVKQAKQVLAKINEDYLLKKVDYLESKSQTAKTHWQQRHQQLENTVKEQQQKSAEIVKSATEFYKDWITENGPSVMNNRMTAWIPVEISIYEDWAANNGDRSINEFYREQVDNSVVLRGVVEPYARPIRNKPGDYILVNKINRLPIAYLYSTQVNLQDHVGKEIAVKAVLRPNNHFAYPAYMVLSVE